MTNSIPIGIIIGMDNRSRILTCALQLFADQGYDAVGVQEIVDAAGITKPTLYHYFGSKHGLLDALLAEHFERFNQNIREAAVYTGDLPLTLRHIVMAYIEYAQAHPTFYRLQLALWFAPPKSEAHQSVFRWDYEQHQIVERVFLAAVREHGNMKGRHRAYATTLVGMINTYIGMALNGHTELNEVLVSQALHQFQHGIYS